MNNIVKHILSRSGFYWLIYYFLIPLKRNNLVSDKVFLYFQYRCICGKRLNLKSPISFNEKLQWLKLYDRKPHYPEMVDKHEAKKYVAKIIGDEYIIPTLGVWNRFGEIDFDSLPNRFVLKCTHNSGCIVVCKDKSTFDIKKAETIIKVSLKENFYYSTSEWVYKNLQPRIIAEEYMEDSTGELRDYKFFCFDGVPKALFIATDRLNKNEDTKFDFFDMDFEHLPFRGGHPNANKPIACPLSFEEMKEIAKELSKGIPHVRVDLYDVDGKVFFGELTFFHWGGIAPFDPPEWNDIFGSWINLPQRQS